MKATPAASWAMLALALALLSACTSALPPIDPGAFACIDDEASTRGATPCPDADWCLDGSCTRRLGCFSPTAGGEGCDPDRRCELYGEDCQRCGLRVTDQVAAVTCEPGVHTTTSTRPTNAEACACPDGTACVAFADGAPGEAYPLYILPSGGALPASRLGVTGEAADRRVCARGCAGEADCPAGHTCRPAAAVNAALLAAPTSGRSTVGVCWPDVFPGTSSTSVSAPPDPLACEQHSDCPRGSLEPCRFRVVLVPDHPRAPLGEAWGERRALVARCSTENPSLRNADDGCTLATECKSGLCVEGRCARPCDPTDANVCPANRACVDVAVSRKVDGIATAVEDRAWICAP